MQWTVAVALVALLAGVADARPRAALTPTSSAGFGVNYYPASGGWRFQWQRFSRASTDRDFAAIRRSGATWVRIIVAPEVFGFPDPSAVMSSRLAEVVQLASREGLQIHLTLFDMFDNWGRISDSEAWTRALLAPLVGDPTVTELEVHNEIDPNDPAAVTWARALIPFLRALTHRPIGISVPASDGVAGLTSLSASSPGRRGRACTRCTSTTASRPSSPLSWRSAPPRSSRRPSP